MLSFDDDDDLKSGCFFSLFFVSNKTTADVVPIMTGFISLSFPSGPGWCSPSVSSYVSGAGGGFGFSLHPFIHPSTHPSRRASFQEAKQLPIKIPAS